MNEISFSYYQVMTVSLFLLALVLAHFYVKKNKGSLSAKFGTSKYMQIVEDLSISQTEKIRLVKIGSELILIATSKGSSPTVQLLNNISYKRSGSESVKSIKTSGTTVKEISKREQSLESKTQKPINKGYGNALKTAIQQARKMNPHVSF